MVATNLREYLSGIDKLIDSNQVEDALAHCRHVLKTYPKNIATYRLMGKAYLESKRHSEASDLFQRVLSSLPDDFVAHIGMSIIREDEGNLDAAIWHMERAFESQPSNKAVQGEVRRLYGAREGYEPPKVRLTRGALARMYSHGDLYNQAIGELRNALAEDAQRPDLQVLLAEMHFKNNQPDEASAVCSQIIQKLPYCLHANRIMVDILRNSQRDVEATPYWERVEELDPYAAQVSTLKEVDEVPAESVMIDALELDSPMLLGAPQTAAPEAELDFEKEELPDWLSVEELDSQAENETAQPESVMSRLEGLEPLDADDAGNAAFMDELASGDMPSGHPSLKTGALQPDEIPGWLRELRPGVTPPPPPAGMDPDAPGKRWTEEFKQAGFNPTGPLNLDDVSAHEAAAYEGGLPAEPSPEAAASHPNDAAAIEPEAAEGEGPQATGRPTGWLPTGELRWLDTAFNQEDAAAEPAGEGAEPAAQPARELPGWLAELNEDDLSNTQPTRPAASAFVDSPAFIEPEPELQGDDEEPADALAAPSEESSTQPSWLDELQASSGMQDDDTGDLPRTDELNDVESTQRLDALAGWQTPAQDDEQPASELEPLAEDQPAAASPPSDEDETLSWLEGLAARRGVAEEELLTDPEQRSTTKPDWLQAEQAEASAAPLPSDNLNWLDELAAAADPVAAADNEDEAVAGVSADSEDESEEAEAMHSLEEDSPFSQELPDEALEAEPEDSTPTWLRQFTGTLPEQPAAEPIAPRPLDNAPDWLSELRPQDPDSLAAASVAAQDTPQWPSEPELSETELEPAAAEATAAPADDTPEWLHQMVGEHEPAWPSAEAEEQDALAEDEDTEAGDEEAPSPAIEPRWVPATELPSEERSTSASPDSRPMAEASEPEAAAIEPESDEAGYVEAQELTYATDEYEYQAPEELPARELEDEDVAEDEDEELAPAAPLAEAQPEAPAYEASQPAEPEATPQATPKAYESEASTRPEPVIAESSSTKIAAKDLSSEPTELYEAEAEPVLEAQPLASPVARASNEAPAATAAPRKRARGLTAEELDDRLAAARQALSYGNLGDAAEAYSYFLRRRIRLDEIIADLRAASRRFPRQVAVWQTLGDAYMRNNQLTDALECYTRAKSLL
ncbi:MAG TPA: tetratricopeptide repeat protein [Anaerolineales bacterium]|nr:tetratricopeptide repeat protein [Anaerolineales bacterium]HRQ91459.1 tetratricopeptide repeat protein [Anaerolineales bacterium]